MSAYKPAPDEAQFLGEVVCIDAGLATICADLLRKGTPLREVRATLEDALKIARTLQGKDA